MSLILSRHATATPVFSRISSPASESTNRLLSSPLGRGAVSSSTQTIKMAAQPAFSGTAFNNNNNNNHYFPASLSEMSNRGALVETPLSGVDRTFPRGPATLDMSAPQPYPNYNVYDPNREDVDYPAQISGLVGSEDSLDDPEASSSAGRTGSDNEADSVNKSDKAFQHLVYDPTT